MLLCLAYSPVNAPYVEDRTPPVVATREGGWEGVGLERLCVGLKLFLVAHTLCVAHLDFEEDINWKEYLMEGVVIPSFTSDSESEVCTCAQCVELRMY